MAIGTSTETPTCPKHGCAIAIDSICQECLKDSEIRYVGDVQRLELKPGDVIVFRAKQPLAHNVIARIKETAERNFDGHKVVVIDGDIDIAAISLPPKEGQ